jgi:hypothetical protein
VEDVIGMVLIAIMFVMCIVSLCMVVNIVETILDVVGMVILRVVVKQVVTIQRMFVQRKEIVMIVVTF